MPNYHTIIIGAGLAGLTAACHLAQAGKKTLLVSGGVGTLVLASGCIDVLGYQPTDSKTPPITSADSKALFERVTSWAASVRTRKSGSEPSTINFSRGP